MVFSLSFITFFLFTLKVSCLEEPERELFLEPRNFNPHPYQAKLSFGATNPNRGPVLFPENSPDPLNPNPEENLVEGQHPYAPLVRKFKYRLGGLLETQEQYTNKQAFKALTLHAAQVLKRPIDELDSSLSDQKKSYAFSYKVRDHISGDDFSHKQEQRSGSTSGEYRVKLPDGRIQIVTYVADQNGYKADVKYTEDAKPQFQPVFVQNFDGSNVFHDISNRLDKLQLRRRDKVQEYLDENSLPLNFHASNSRHTSVDLPTYHYVEKDLYSHLQ